MASYEILTSATSTATHFTPNPCFLKKSDAESPLKLGKGMVFRFGICAVSVEVIGAGVGDGVIAGAVPTVEEYGAVNTIFMTPDLRT